MTSQTSGTSSFEVMVDDPIRRVELALDDLRQGKMVILVDDEDRENEGDLVLAADKVTPQAINFMATHARGLICLAITSEQVERLGLPMMASNNKSAYETAFTVSIEAREGVTTGISAADRAHTTKVAIAKDATPRSIVVPGHVFPLRARDGGVLERVGQTEGSVDLARLAGLDPSGVICEIMNPDGTMSRLPELLEFGKEHQLRICSVADIIKYRTRSERIVVANGQGQLDIVGLGTWNCTLYESVVTNSMHIALSLGELDGSPTLARVQPAPPSWGFLSEKGKAQGARAALAAVREAGKGVVVLMHLSPGVDVLRHQFHQEVGADSTAPARNSAEALRDLGAGCQILKDLGLSDLRLLTNSKRPLLGLDAYGISIAERVALTTA